jgi:hypothetical protein
MEAWAPAPEGGGTATGAGPHGGTGTRLEGEAEPSQGSATWWEPASEGGGTATGARPRGGTGTRLEGEAEPSQGSATWW